MPNLLTFKQLEYRCEDPNSDMIFYSQSTYVLTIQGKTDAFILWEITGTSGFRGFELYLASYDHGG